MADHPEAAGAHSESLQIVRIAQEAEEESKEN